MLEFSMIYRVVLTMGVSMLSVLALFQAGCTDAPVGAETPELAKVTGTVTVGGRTYEGVTVIFTPQEGGGSSMGETDANGNYELEFGGGGAKGAVVGTHMVAFRHNEEEIVNGEPIPGGESVLPDKYWEGASQITREVKPGEQVIDFELDGR
jgi:hypothetical protein